MEEVEAANRAAVESCHRVLSSLSRPQDQVQCRNLTAETGEAVFKFKRVISLLNSGLGHARVRKLKKLPSPLSQRIFLDTPNQRTNNNFQFLQSSNYLDKDANNLLSLELSSNGKNPNPNPNPNPTPNPSPGSYPLHLSQQAQSAHYQFLQQQQRLQFQQQMKQQAEMMYRRSNSGVHLSFDNSSCTPTMSSTRSFLSSLSMDGSVANLGGNSFHLIGGPQSSNHSSQQHKRKCSARGEDGSVKCGSTGRCHCSKKRKHRIKRSIKVPAISNKLADIPPDDYSWRKYGQKPIKGSPHPRGYYKCSSMRGCPARKHVERCLEEPTMLIVTYEGEHNHPRIPSQSAIA